jgi:hemerythrin-like metal-binding protein
MATKWRSEFDTGIQAIDADHRKLVDLLNQVQDAVETGGAQATLQKVVRELVDYVTQHFDREEKMLEACNYPKLESHIDLHLDFAGRVRSLLGHDFASADKAEAQELMTFLSGWLIDHILQEDRKYIPWAKKA